MTGAGNTATDKRGNTTWTFTSDAEQRLAQVKSGASARGAYLYDAFFKLAKRTVTNTTPAGHDLYDPDGRVIAGTNSAGVAIREYAWLHYMPVAVIDAVHTASPVTYFVHTDHLMRPLKMTTAAGGQVWDAVWKPFGEALTITAARRVSIWSSPASGNSSKARCTATGTGTTIPRPGATRGPIRWGSSVGRAFMGMRDRRPSSSSTAMAAPFGRQPLRVSTILSAAPSSAAPPPPHTMQCSPPCEA